MKASPVALPPTPDPSPPFAMRMGGGGPRRSGGRLPSITAKAPQNVSLRPSAPAIVSKKLRARSCGSAAMSATVGSAAAWPLAARAATTLSGTGQIDTVMIGMRRIPFQFRRGTDGRPTVGGVVMQKPLSAIVVAALLASSAPRAAAQAPGAAGTPTGFRLLEATIDDVQAAWRGAFI